MQRYSEKEKAWLVEEWERSGKTRGRVSVPQPGSAAVKSGVVGPDRVRAELVSCPIQITSLTVPVIFCHAKNYRKIHLPRLFRTGH
jgi:hypothetical protein